MCELLDVSRSGYYDWVDRGESPRETSNRQLVPVIRAIFEESDGTYGSPRVCRELRAVGMTIGENRVARVMRSESIRVWQKRAWRRTTNSAHDRPIAPNTLDRDFTPERPNQVWAGDTTYIATPDGWLFLVVILDLFSRKVVGWALGTRLDGDLSCRALQSALATRERHGDLLYHSDRGIEFACDAFRTQLREAEISASMSRRGNCWDNAVVESFFSTLKKELIYRKTFSTRSETESAVFRFMEGFYNRRRRHSTLGYMTPVEYEQQFAA